MRDNSASIVIAFYKRLDFLEKIFEGLDNQSNQSFEVIVAEDDNSQATIDFIERVRQSHHFLIKHISQEDKGFRKNMILNKALKIAASPNILFLDGDCIPHRHFVRQYCSHLSKGTAYFGRRIMLGEKFTAKLLARDNTRMLNAASILFSDSKKVEEALYLPWFNKKQKEYRGIWGCNWGTDISDLKEVNGFDEDYVHACVGEDNDIEWRLRLNGVQFKSLKHKAIVYHMYHRENYDNESLRINNELFENKKKLNSVTCLNGLEKVTELRTSGS